MPPAPSSAIVLRLLRPRAALIAFITALAFIQPRLLDGQSCCGGGSGGKKAMVSIHHDVQSGFYHAADIAGKTITVKVYDVDENGVESTEPIYKESYEPKLLEDPADPVYDCAWMYSHGLGGPCPPDGPPAFEEELKKPVKEEDPYFFIKWGHRARFYIVIPDSDKHPPGQQYYNFWLNWGCAGFTSGSGPTDPYGDVEIGKASQQPCGYGTASLGSASLQVSVGSGYSLAYDQLSLSASSFSSTSVSLPLYPQAEDPAQAFTGTDGATVKCFLLNRAGYSVEKLTDGNGRILQVRTPQGLTKVTQLKSQPAGSAEPVDSGFKIETYSGCSDGKTEGLYTPTGTPHSIWLVERTAQTDEIRVTEKHGVETKVFTFTNTEGESWEMEEGTLRRGERKRQVTLSNGEFATIYEVRDHSTNPPTVVSRRVEVQDDQGRLTRTVRGEIDANAMPVGNAEWTCYQYNAAGLEYMERSDGYWEVYSTYTAKSVIPAPDGASTLIKPTSRRTYYSSGNVRRFADSVTPVGLLRTEVQYDDVGGYRRIRDHAGGAYSETFITPIKDPDNPDVIIGERTTRDAGGACRLVSEHTSHPSNAPFPFAERPKSDVQEDGSSTAFFYDRGAYDPTNHTFTSSGTGLAVRTATRHRAPNQPDSWDVNVVDPAGNAVLDETHAAGTDATPGPLLTRRFSTYDVDGHLVTIEQAVGGGLRTVYSATYISGRKTTETDESGVVTSFDTFDDAGRPQRIIRSFLPAAGDLAAVPEQIHHVAYDVEGRLVSEHYSSGGVTSGSHTWQYDTAGRLIAESTERGLVTYTYRNGRLLGREIDQDGKVKYTSHDADATDTVCPGRLVTKTGPDGTEYTRYNLDGTLFSITGDNVIAQTFSYGSAGGDLGVFEQVTRGNPGHAVGDSSHRVVTRTYRNGLGQITGELDATGRMTHYQYETNETGQITATVLTDASGVPFRKIEGEMTTLYADPDPPREVIVSTEYVTDTDGAIWLKAWDSRAGESWRKMSGFTANELSVTRQVSKSGSTETSIVTVDLSTQSIATSVATKLSATAAQMNPRITISRAGMVESIKEPGISVATRITYDGFGRELSRFDPRTPAISTTTGYDDFDRLGNPVSHKLSRIARGAEVTTITYYPAGQGLQSGQVATRTVNGLTTRYDYDSFGRLRHVWGATYPLWYEYDDAGRLWKLHTYRDETLAWTGGAWPANAGDGDVTTWLYSSEAEQVVQKLYADNRGPTYGYVQGRLTNRIWARGVTTHYDYNRQGELTAITYPGENPQITPPVTYTRDDEGRLHTVTDGAGTRTFAYTENAAGLIVTETMSAGSYLGATTFTHTFDAAGRPTGYNFDDGIAGNQPIAANYGYDPATGQFTSILRGEEQIASYQYNPQTGWMDVMGNITRFPDDQGRVQKIIRTGDNPLSPSFLVKYDFDSAGRRQRLTREDGSYWEYGYNGRSEVTSGIKYYANNTEIPGYHFTYSFDAIGNRKQSVVGTGPNAAVTDYTANALNQYTTRTIPNQAGVRAQLTIPPNQGYKVAVNGNEVQPDAQGRLYVERHEDNTQKPLYLRNHIAVFKPTDPNQPNAKDPITAASAHSETYLGKTPLTAADGPLYDEDGNTLRDERWSYVWDAENRLVRLETLPEAVAAGAPNKQIVFKYDSDHRRVSAISAIYASGGLRLGGQDTAFSFDGWSVIAEFERPLGGSAYARKSSHYWGPDLSEALASAGGIGGLILSETITADGSIGGLRPLCDANGNILAVRNAAMSSVAVFDYAPLGETVLATGPLAQSTPFRFSSHRLEAESDLIYAKRRHYSPKVGQWLSRDPLQDEAATLDLSRRMDPSRIAVLRSEAAPAAYSYLKNGAPNSVDPFGLYAWDPTARKIQVAKCQIVIILGHADKTKPIQWVFSSNDCSAGGYYGCWPKDNAPADPFDIFGELLTYNETVLFGSAEGNNAKLFGPSGYNMRNERLLTSIWRPLLLKVGAKARDFCEKECCSKIQIQSLILEPKVPPVNFDYDCSGGKPEELRFLYYIQQWWADYKRNYNMK